MRLDEVEVLCGKVAVDSSAVSVHTRSIGDGRGHAAQNGWLDQRVRGRSWWAAGQGIFRGVVLDTGVTPETVSTTTLVRGGPWNGETMIERPIMRQREGIAL